MEVGQCICYGADGGMVETQGLLQAREAGPETTGDLVHGSGGKKADEWGGECESTP